MFFRKYENAYQDIDFKHLREMAKETGCIKPCKYKKYRLDWDQQPMPAEFKSADGFGLSPTSNHTTVGFSYSYQP